jgi:para-nitrobenzyl esterase
VLVSYHGGGWATGSGNGPMYDGARMALWHDVVVVTVNHRLASFGYTHLADLGAPAAFRYAGVCGVMDMVASLQWVRANIERFGGDPNRVMIFGQSGGGSKTSTMLAVPAAKGLFQRAAVQSGSTLRQATREEATAEADKLLRALGIGRGNIADIQKVPWQRLLEAQVASNGNFRPVIDGEVLPHHPFDPAAPVESADVPVIISTTLHDAALRLTNFDLTEAGLADLLRQRFGPSSDRILAAYRAENPRQSPYLTQAEAFTDATRGNSQIQALRKSRLGRAPTYMYVWNWATPAFDGKFGAVHGHDVEASFHLSRNAIGGAGTHDGRLMSDRLASTWAAFAATGDPNNATIPHWPAYEPGRRATLVFDVNMRVVDDYRGEFVRMLADASPTVPDPRKA